jgi:putative oxidoreductase
MRSNAPLFADAEPRLVFAPLRNFYAFARPRSYAMLRIGFGLTMLTHGLPKVMGTSHGSMADPMAGSVNLIANVLHLPAATELAMFVALLETIGGLMVAAGFLTRLAAPMMAVQMAVICLALGPTWPWIDRGIEYPLMMGLLALFISFAGGGPGSVDRLIGREI